MWPRLGRVPPAVPVRGPGLVLLLDLKHCVTMNKEGVYEVGDHYMTPAGVKLEAVLADRDGSCCYVCDDGRNKCYFQRHKELRLPCPKCHSSEFCFIDYVGPRVVFLEPELVPERPKEPRLYTREEVVERIKDFFMRHNNVEFYYNHDPDEDPIGPAEYDVPRLQAEIEGYLDRSGVTNH